MATDSKSSLSFETILDHVQAGVMVFDTLGAILAINSAAATLLGIDPHRVIGRSDLLGAWNCLREDGSKMSVNEYPVNRVLAEKTIVSDLVIGFPAGGSGQTTWVLANARPVLGNNGTIETVVVTFVDLTGRKRLEEELLSSRERCRCLSEAAFEGIMVHENGIILDANREFIALFGYKDASELIGKPGLRILIAERSRPALMAVMNKEEYAPIEIVCMKKDGSEFVAETRGRQFNYGGKPVRVVSVRDITAKRRDEEMVRKAGREWQQTFDGTRDAICLLEPDQKIVRCNRAMADLFHTPLDEITGKFCYEVVHGTSAPVDGCPVERMKQSLRRETMELHIYGRWFEVSVDPILGENGTLCGMVHSVRDITDRIRSREELARSEEKYRTLAESSPEMIYLIDRDCVVRYINTVAANMFHAKADRIIGNHLRDLYPAPVAESHMNAINSVIKTGKPLSNEIMEPFPGGMHWIDARLSPVRDGSGAIIGVLGLSQDISERKRMEQELKKSIELYHDLVETAQDLIWQCDAEGRYTYLNPAWETVFGYTVEEMLGRKFTDFESEDQARKDMKEFSRLLNAGITIGYETVHRAMDGREVYLVFNAKYIRDANGIIIGTRGTAYDITARKKMEMELRKSEERLSSLFSNMAEGVALHEVVFDNEGKPVNYRIVDCNLQYEKILGIKREDACGKLATEAYGTPEPPYLVEFTTPGITGVPAHMETYFPPMDKHFDISIAPWGKNGFATIFTDITQRRKMEEELLRKHKMDALGVLAGGIAHDFNNLLAGVFGFMDLARESMKPGDPAVGYLGKAFIAFERTKSLSRQLLTFSKGGMPVKHPIRLADVLRECCNLSLSGSNVRCVFSLQDNLAVVDADEHQLSQVFSNIMINARQAMPEGGCLTISGENRTLSDSDGIPLPEGAYVTIAIKDEGIGIPEKILHKIFDPFFTTKQQGSGLGLAICYSIIKKHGGHISVDSAPGSGATFTIWLPASGKAALPNGRDRDAASLKGTENVLVMDDEPSIREMAMYILTSFGYSVVTVADGREAVEKYRSAKTSGKPFDLVILDLTVPGGMGGEKAIVELRKIDPDVIACVTSGYADNAILSDPGAYGFAGMIAKPYLSTDLLKMVREALGKKKGRT